MTPLPTSRSIVLFDPSVSSLNLGDHIISASCESELGDLLDGAFVVRVSSHLPLSKYLTYMNPPDNRFVCGSNLLRGRMNARFRQWDITPFTAKFAAPSILMGVGWWQYGDEPNAYTRWLYGRVLSKEVRHSVRDAYTAHQLERCGIKNVVNTGCPTMWRLTEAHCARIPTERSTSVVTTVTDYSRDPSRDRSMLLQLTDLYETVHLWIQGAGDLSYYKSLNLADRNIHLVPPRLQAYDRLLELNEIDYVGTRLHAGIRALQRGRRSVIIGVDNRAAEKNRDFNLPFLPRENILQLSRMVEGSFTTRIEIPVKDIELWKGQFASTDDVPSGFGPI